MSLLLDALKRAEQEKRARQGAEPPAAATAPAMKGPASPRPVPAAAPLGALELEAIDAPRAGPAAPAPAPGERGAAQQVFAAKRATPEEPASKLPIVLGAAGLVLLLVAAGGVYVWYQMRALSPKAAPLAGARPPTPVVAASAPPAMPMPPAAPRADPAAPALAVLKPDSADAKRPRPEPEAAEQLVMELLREAPPAGATPPLKLARSIDPPRVAPAVATGYEQLRKGDLAAAKRSYEAALATEPLNLDAVLGLATVEARAGQREHAERLYRRALQIDPRNAVALAGLAALADFSRPADLERQVRADLARNPRSAPLQFTLGNVLAAQSRWSDAQEAFFEAHRLDAKNADYAHNLAVALDQLGQARVARQFYARALALAEDMPVHFDIRAVERRMAELKPS